jgi:hypothetical protein
VDLEPADIRQALHNGRPVLGLEPDPGASRDRGKPMLSGVKHGKHGAIS